jgi:predicted nucleic-acid-binding Zn-ribbon protein
MGMMVRKNRPDKENRKKINVFTVSVSFTGHRSVVLSSEPKLRGSVMASWVLRCPKCHKTFFHSEIASTLANLFIPKKPKFPEGGQTLPCKNCGDTSIYQRNELIYQR